MRGTSCGSRSRERVADFWALYVRGDGDFIDELAAGVSTRTETVALDDPLVGED